MLAPAAVSNYGSPSPPQRSVGQPLRVVAKDRRWISVSQITPEGDRVQSEYELELALIELATLRSDNDRLRNKLRRLFAAYVAFESLLANAAGGHVSGCDQGGDFNLDISTMDLADAEIMVREMMGLCRGLQGVIKPLLSLSDD